MSGNRTSRVGNPGSGGGLGGRGFGDGGGGELNWGGEGGEEVGGQEGGGEEAGGIEGLGASMSVSVSSADGVAPVILPSDLSAT